MLIFKKIINKNKSQKKGKALASITNIFFGPSLWQEL